MASTVNKENLFKDILEDDFVKAFKPIHYAQQILGFGRVNTKYSFVTGPTTLSKFYGSAIIFANIVSSIHIIMNAHVVSKSPSTDYTLKLGMAINIIITNTILWRINFLNGNLNAELYVKLQRIDRDLNIKNLKNLNNKLFISFLVITLQGILFTIIWIVAINIKVLDNFYVSLFLALLPSLGNHFETILAFQLMLFIKIRLNHVNKCLQNEIVIEKKSKNNSKVTDKITWQTNDKKTDQEACCGLVLGMHNVLDALAIFKDLYEFEIFALFCQFISWNFITMRTLATALKEQTFADMSVFICNVPLLTAMVVMIIILSFMGNTLTGELENTRKLCINMSSYCAGKARVTANQILLMMGDDSCDMSIYDILTLNTQLPLNLFVITANYAMVFLQFAML